MWAEQRRSSSAHSCSGFLWCATYSIPSLIPSPHSWLRKPLYTEFPMCLNDHSQFMQHFVNTELLLSRELKCYLCCSSQACSSSQPLLVTFLCRYIAMFLNSIWLSCQNMLLICFLMQQHLPPFLQLSTSRCLLNIHPWQFLLIQHTLLQSNPLNLNWTTSLIHTL